MWACQAETLTGIFRQLLCWETRPSDRITTIPLSWYKGSLQESLLHSRRMHVRCATNNHCLVVRKRFTGRTKRDMCGMLTVMRGVRVRHCVKGHGGTGMGR